MNTEKMNLKAMQASIENIEKHVLVLRDLGTGIPAVEKNARILLSIVRNLKFGIGDPAALLDQ